MELLRRYMWLWVILGSIFVGVVITIIFLLINKCISRSGKHRISHLKRGSDFPVNSNKYQETNLKADIPPLPPRTQFLTAEAQSYENLAEVPDYEQDKHDYEQSMPDYEQDKHDYEQSVLDYEQDKHDYVQTVPDYEQDKHDYEQSIPDYEQNLDEQPDYVKVEEEQMILPPPPSYKDPDLAADDVSMEDYDDIGGEDDTQDEEDYDDVA